MKKLCLFLMLLLLLSLSEVNSIKSLSDFGMNKPHLLFHLGERRSVAVNYGMGYWLNNYQS